MGKMIDSQSVLNAIILFYLLFLGLMGSLHLLGLV